MSSDPLDRPVWAALTGRQSHLAVASGGVVRIDPRYGPFAAVTDNPGALAAVLNGPEDGIGLVETMPVEPPSGLRVVNRGELVQMVSTSLGPEPHDPRIVALGEDDAEEMAVLAHATEPGPWGPLTHRYGQYYGIRIDGRLAAMAGERMLLPEHAEVSGVCTWPEFRGQGMAAALIRRVMRGFVERGDTPFLHSYATNAGAIRLYETLGFRVRRTMALTVLALA